MIEPGRNFGPSPGLHADVHHQFAVNNQDSGRQIYSPQTNNNLKTPGAAKGAQTEDIRSRVALALATPLTSSDKYNQNLISY
jgi:hypothetical protein